MPSRKAPEAVTASSSPAVALFMVKSVGRPYATLGVTPIRGRGFVFSLTDSLAREVTTPTIPIETIARALEGGVVIFRNGGFTVEMTPVDEVIKIRCLAPSGAPIEGTFQADEIERSTKLTGPTSFRRDMSFSR